MSRYLKGRLERLEGRGGDCNECGWGPDTTFEVEWDHDDDEVDEDEEPEYCSACGRPDTIVVTWGDVGKKETKW